MGALSPILYQGAIPVFADVDAKTYNLTARTIASCMSERTRAIIVTHLFGNPCDMVEIMKLAQARDIPVIEDCAQAFLAQYNVRVLAQSRYRLLQPPTGTALTTGEGALSRPRQALAAPDISLHHKAWATATKPDHYFSSA